MVGTVLVFPHKKEPRSRDGVGPPSLKNKFHLLTCLIVLYTLRYFSLLFSSLYEIKFNFFLPFFNGGAEPHAVFLTESATCILGWTVRCIAGGLVSLVPEAPPSH